MNETYYYWQCPMCYKETYSYLQKQEHISTTQTDEKHKYRDTYSRYQIETRRIVNG